MVKINIYQTKEEFKGLARRIMENKQKGISVREGRNIFDIFREYGLDEELIKYRREHVTEIPLPTNIFVTDTCIYFSIYGKDPLIVEIKDEGLVGKIKKYLRETKRTAYSEKPAHPEEVGAISDESIESCCF